jgi:hypothetical protein
LRGQARTATEKQYLPAEKYPYLLLSFLIPISIISIPRIY